MHIETYTQLAFWLLVAHYVCDYPLQGDFLAQAKNRHTPAGKHIWQYALTAHGFIHAGGVALVTGSIVIGLLELFAHCLIDYAKCDNKIDFGTDQALHIFCKSVWLGLVYVFFPLP